MELRDVLLTLPPRQRAVLVLRYVDDLTDGARYRFPSGSWAGATNDDVYALVMQVASSRVAVEEIASRLQSLAGPNP